jgi:purine nucleosidase
MAVLLDPTIKLDESRHYVAIECSSNFSRGMTVVDRLDVAADPRNAAVWSEIMRTSQKVEVCWRIDVPWWKAALVTALKPLDEVVPKQE